MRIKGYTFRDSLLRDINVDQSINVRFTLEVTAADIRGPRKEFLQLMLQECKLKTIPVCSKDLIRRKPLLTNMTENIMQPYLTYMW